MTNNCYFSDNAAYMDATFAWDFDADDNDHDGRYEKASGFVAAHMFEHPGTRILFKRGDTFDTPYFEAGPYDGPVIIDSYEDPAEPSGDAPVICSPEVDNAYATFVIYADDWRLMNIAVRSGGSSYEGPRYPNEG